MERVNTVSSSFLGQDRVVCVLGQVLGVGVVRRGEFNGADEVLVEETLANMASGNIVTQSSVAVQGSVGVHHQVDVGGTGGVVTREGGLELSNTISVSLLDTTEPGIVDVRLV